jgi:hypothetical protein
MFGLWINNMDNNNDFDIFFILNIISNLLQIVDYQLNVSQVSNDEIMKHLQKQDGILSEQTNIYLKQIIKQNEEIKEILREVVKNV